MKRTPRTIHRLIAYVALTLVLAGAFVRAAPPYQGTIFLDPDILTESDPTSFEGLTSTGRGDRWMFDRRENDWVFLRPHLFQARYDDGLTIEIQMNPRGLDVLAKTRG